MRILYITLENLSLHKGSVVHVKEIVSNLRKIGHDIGLVACSYNQEENADRFYNLNVTNFLPLGLFKSKRQPHIISLIILFFYLFKILPKHDILYVREYPTVILSFFPRLIFSRKLVFEVNGIANEERQLKKHSLFNRILVFFIKFAEKIATKHSEKIIAVAPKIKDYLVQNFNCPQNKIHVITNGVNTEKFLPIHEEPLLNEWRKKLGIQFGDTVITFVGNLAPWQGIDDIIDITFNLLSKNKNIKLLIVGDGPLKSLLLKKVLSSGYERDIVFAGMVDHEDIPIIINLADICVAPLRVGTGSPIKIFEYLACGKPVVASKIEGLEFIEIDGVGLLRAPEDKRGLEEALNELIQDPKKRTNMGQKGIHIARFRFSWKSRVTEIEDLLKNLA